MQIEVLNKNGDANKSQGDVLESFSAEWLKIKGYSVERNLRLTACELDLLCKDVVSGKEIYVECKAYNSSNISASILKELLGTVDFHKYTEGWLITTGTLGKDAKGFMDQWERRDDRARLAIYTPERIVTGLIDAKIIIPPPQTSFAAKLKKDSSVGDWILILCDLGKFWATTVLKNGIPQHYIIFSSTTGVIISDPDFLAKIAETNFSLLALNYWNEASLTLEKTSAEQCPIVEVEFGERWSDYRPARPEHFVGRKKNIKELFHFVSEVKKGRTETRVFAIKGDSGIGKSSLVAKLREDAKLSQKPSNLFVYAVDVRAASSSSYITTAFLQCLLMAQQSGLGVKNNLEITNSSNPTDSPSIKNFLSECTKRHQVIIFILDQFEELYSKPDLFDIFKEAQKLMFSIISVSTNLIIGFAWKTDCSVPQDHPAYHMWHNLADLRFEISLGQFSHSDAEHSLNIFESELSEKIRPDLRKYILSNSQGYPWLLKKLCIHFLTRLTNGVSQIEMENSALDIASLFEQDLNNLSRAETECVKTVAKNAPMAWCEVIDTSGREIVQSLQDKRILIKRGNTLNLYWDIFKDYVLTRSVPEIPFNYIPQSASIDGLLRVAMQLDNAEPKSMKKLAELTEFKETTVRNILHDLRQFGISRNDTDINHVLLDDSFTEIDEKTLFARLRAVFKRHQLTLAFKNRIPNAPANQQQIVSLLRKIIPSAQHDTNTWIIYANKMRQLLIRLGYLTVIDDSVIYEDKGDVVVDQVSFAYKKPGGLVFIADASPAKTQEAFLYIALNGPQPVVHMKNLVFRNACAVLARFGMISLSQAYTYETVYKSCVPAEILQEIFKCATNENSINITIEELRNNPGLQPTAIGNIIAKRYDRKWLESTKLRIGGGLRTWAQWIIASVDNNIIAPPPGNGIHYENEAQLTFHFERETCTSCDYNLSEALDSDGDGSDD